MPEIVRSKSRSRRAVKSIMFLCCTVGFLYQTYTFLEVFIKYETIQNMRIEHPIQFMAPAITFCNKNRINRELFCPAFPEECFWYKNKKDFCNAAPRLCAVGTKTFAVLRKISQKHHNSSNEFLDVYGSHLIGKYDNLFFCKTYRNGEVEYRRDNDSIPIHVPSDGLPYKCFSFYSLFDKPNAETSKMSIFDSYLFHIFTHPKYLMNDKDSSQVDMYFHDPRRLVNPIAEGITLTVGYHYTFSLTMQQMQNLPPPYDTNCMDYMKKWKENGGRGPLTKKDCIEFCKIERMMEQHSCVGKNITYPHIFPICSEIITISDKVVEDCSSGCREACDVTLYTIAGKHKEDKKFKTRVSVQRTFKEPKFQDIELFSYIGGFIGIWLEISLVTFVDFLETVSDIITFAVMNWKKMHEKKIVRRRFRY